MLLFVPTRTPLHPCCRPLHPGCPPRACRLAKQQLCILIFPGTEVLWKHYLEVPRPQGHHVLVPSPDRWVPPRGWVGAEGGKGIPAVLHETLQSTVCIPTGHLAPP